ncbi:MAG TPA: MFS transporter [Pirellulales bacterium]|nr:MFS transporter [Pirellulales bacterium]
MSNRTTNVRQSLGFMVRSLRHRNFALFFSGQLVSLVGTWLSLVATSWLVYRLTRDSASGHSAFMLGVVNFAAQIPIFLLAPLAGVWLDRWNRHRVLQATQTLSMVQSFAMGYLVLSEHITLVQIIALSIFQGIVNALDILTRQSFLVQMIDEPEDLSNAIALNSSMVQAARLVGPAVAGFLIYAFGEGLCFVIDGFSFLAVLGALLAMRIAPRPATQKHLPVTSALWQGLVYAFGFAPIRALLSIVAIVSLMAMSQSVLMPIYANQILGGNERTLGILLGSAGMGALAGAIYLTSRRSVLGLGRVIVIGSVALGAAMIVLASSSHLVLSLAALVVAGAAMLVQAASCNTLLQTIVDEDKRGRVMSLFAMAFMGMAPFGSLLAGSVATELGIRWTLALAGLVCVTAGGIFALHLRAIRPLIRPIYIAKGILPAVVADPQAATDIPADELAALSEAGALKSAAVERDSAANRSD